jgi:hypothetical protein
MKSKRRSSNSAWGGCGSVAGRGALSSVAVEVGSGKSMHSCLILAP